MKTYNQLMSVYKDIEFTAHLELDDIINKVTQECGEIIQAKENDDKNEMYKESNDALINVLSTSFGLGVTPDFENIEKKSMVTSSQLLINLANWNTKIQAYRNRYSRQNETIDGVLSATNSLVSDILSFSDVELSIQEMITSSIEKFSSRVEKYLPNINISDYIENVPDFPKPGIQFKDISPLLQDPEAMRYVTFELAKQCKDADVIAGLDARGFLFGEAVAQILGKPFVMIRKAGKLPGDTIGTEYGLEYGKDKIEIKKDGIKSGQKVSIIDDLLATGGTMEAATKLVEKAGGIVNNVAFVISLDEEGLKNMPARKTLEKFPIGSILSYK